MKTGLCGRRLPGSLAAVNGGCRQARYQTPDGALPSRGKSPVAWPPILPVLSPMLADPVDLLRCDIDPQLRAVEFTVAWTYTTRDCRIPGGTLSKVLDAAHPREP